uniref:Calpain catalytic domain-containing protein n=1 Tax=Macrostomum lignano TaxID=282301 RepID=A0A1I8FK14_9PLAT
MKRQYQAKATKQKQQQQNLEATEAKQLRQAPVEFGPYLTVGTIREDLSADGSCWEFCDFTDPTVTPTWLGEDGLLAFATAVAGFASLGGFWNGKDAFVKEITEKTVKEAYFYQLTVPAMTTCEPNDEFEIYDTGVFDKGATGEICVEYARDDDAAVAAVTPSANTLGTQSILIQPPPRGGQRPARDFTPSNGAKKTFLQLWNAGHPELPTVFASIQQTKFMAADGPGILFTRNEDLRKKKMLISRYTDRAPGPGPAPACARRGQQVQAPCHQLTLAPGAAASVCVRLSNRPAIPASSALSSSGDLAEICRLAYSGLLWSKQYYEYRPTRYLKCREAAGIRNAFSMPDKWEFPWYASWDTVSRPQCWLTSTRTLPRPSWELNAQRSCWPGRHTKCSNPLADLDFARRIYPRLKLNLRLVAGGTSPNDSESDAVYFKSGFLGMDNICAIDRSQVPDNCRIYQADAYAWVFATGPALPPIGCGRWPIRFRALLLGWTGWPGCSGASDISNDAEGFCFDILEERGADGGSRCLVSLLSSRQWAKVFERLFPLREGPADCSDADEGFLGPYGVRMVSRWHRKPPVTLAQSTRRVSPPGCTGGNSNWRGPVWLCMNYLLVQAALRVHEGGRPDPRLRRFARQVCERVLSIFVGKHDGVDDCCDCPTTTAARGEAKEFASQWRGAEFALFLRVLSTATRGEAAVPAIRLDGPLW